MATKFLIVLCFVLQSCMGGVVPAVPAAYSIPYASSYSASVVNHAIAAPVAQQYVAAASAPVAVAPAPLVAAPAPLAVAPSPYNALPYYYQGAQLIAG